jgi:hypothetical protein
MSKATVLSICLVVRSLAVCADKPVSPSSRADLVDVHHHAEPSHKIHSGLVKKTPTSESLSSQAHASARLMRTERESDQSSLFDDAKTIGASTEYDAVGEDEEPSGEEAGSSMEPAPVTSDDEGEEAGEEAPVAPPPFATDEEGEETGEEAPLASPVDEEKRDQDGVAADGEEEMGEDEMALNKEAAHDGINKQLQQVHNAANQLARRKLEQSDDEGEEAGEEAPVAPPPVATDEEGEETGEEAPLASPVDEEKRDQDGVAADGEDEEMGEDEMALNKEAAQEDSNDATERHLAADLASRGPSRTAEQFVAPQELALKHRVAPHELEQIASDDEDEGEEASEDQEPYEVSDTKDQETTKSSGSTQKGDNADAKVEDVRRREEQEERAHAEHVQN